MMKPFTFGPYKRFRAAEFQTRFGTVEYHVTDAETADEVTGAPALVRQFDTREQLENFVRESE